METIKITKKHYADRQRKTKNKIDPKMVYKGIDEPQHSQQNHAKTTTKDVPQTYN